MTTLIILTSFNTLILVSFAILLAFVLYLKVGKKNGTNKKAYTKAQNKKLRNR